MEYSDRPSTITRNTFIVICITLLAILIAMTHRVYVLQEHMLVLQKDVTKSQTWLVSQMSNMKTLSAMTATSSRQTAESLRAELDRAKQQLQVSTGEARELALNDVHRLENQLRVQETKQQALQDQLNHQLLDVRQKTDEKIGGVSDDVSSIKSEVAETKSDLRKALFEYKRMIGDMGVMSGLIATNNKELETLRALGDRKYSQFAIAKIKSPVQVDGVSVILRKADPLRHKFSLDIVSDDMTIAKKDKNLNEPLQFYLRNTNQPYEIVVNDLQKDQIRGYLASPKVEAARVEALRHPN
jgi:DNA repair exonuclease SbcCD ATPase subunit